MAHRLVRSIVLSALLVGLVMGYGFCSAPSSPSVWTRWSPLQWLGIGVAAVLGERLFDALGRAVSRRRQRGAIKFDLRKKGRSADGSQTRNPPGA